MTLTTLHRPAWLPGMADIPPVTAREMQLLGAESIKGTPAASIRASKAGSSVSPEAAKLRAAKAAAARWAKKPTEKKAD